MTNNPRSCRLIITGLVQGVGFRWSMQQEALRLGLSGWVRNRRDGDVEAVARGPEADLQALLQWAQHGPAAARVSEVIQSEWNEAIADGFQQIATA